MQPKKVNEARELSFCMNTHMRIVSNHAKNPRSRFSHFPLINKWHLKKSETYFFDRMAKKQNGDDSLYLS